ncbi:hypothetical protein KY290_007298 [Solanum tuberosum]|uniref:Uncharacterized protein n=1 Tax=Solanum tuberosum TaxID=4113 RepID=A0ABQ7W585_SOLTU|nr:hypothetical protein KY289_007621 [Solanum tuberosum]KAH0775887.1 hypothetical protein KY290_007298 [Solanum tuberosum]
MSKHNSKEVSYLQNFKHAMEELQGAIIISSAFQTILEYSGLMSVLLGIMVIFYSTEEECGRSDVKVKVYFALRGKRKDQTKPWVEAMDRRQRRLMSREKNI